MTELPRLPEHLAPNMRCEFFITVKNEALVLNVSTIPRLKLVPLVRRKVEGTNGMLLRNVLYPPSKPDGVMTQKTTYKIAFSKKKKNVNTCNFKLPPKSSRFEVLRIVKTYIVIVNC